MPNRSPGLALLKPSILALFILVNLAGLKMTWAASITGQVFAVESGNQISISLSSGAKRRVRLIGLRSPAPGTSMGRISKRHLHMLIAGKFVTVRYQTLTPQGDVLGQVLHGGSDINLHMLETGLARLGPDETLAPELLRQYQLTQRQAQLRQAGLWKNRQH